MINPTIALIPSGYKTNTLFTRLPANGNSDLYFSRNSTASRINSKGLVEQVGVNVPSISFDGSCSALRLEETRTNLIGNSELFDNNTWNNYAMVLGENEGVAPDGTLTATSISNSGSTEWGRLAKTSLGLTGKVVSSLHVKSITSDRVYLSASGTFDGGSSVSPVAYFSFSTETWYYVQGDTGAFDEYIVERQKNGWYRIGVVYNSITVSEINYRSVWGNDNTDMYSFLMWGAQGEYGKYMTSYIPRTTGSGVRAMDDSRGSSGGMLAVPESINSIEGVLFFEGSVPHISAQGLISINNGYTDRIQVGYHPVSGANIIRAEVHIDDGVASTGVEVAVLSASVPDVTERNKIAVRYRKGDYSLWINGVERDHHTGNFAESSFNEGKLTRLDLGLMGSVSNAFVGDLYDVRVYSDFLEDSKILELTN